MFVYQVTLMKQVLPPQQLGIEEWDCPGKNEELHEASIIKNRNKQTTYLLLLGFVSCSMAIGTNSARVS